MPEQSTDKTEHDDAPFYVGYLPLPAPIRRFLVPWLVANLVLMLGVGVVIAQQQRDAGGGMWDTATPVTFEGVLTMEPYPLLHTTQIGDDASPLTVLPIEMGKRGARQRLAGLAGHRVKLTGFVIQRTGRVVLGIEAGVAAVEDLGRAPSAAPQINISPLGEHTLVGEIIDPQCYLGAMSPGDGKTHKACATLCITGGIPPLFLLRDAAGNTTTYLLMTDEGGPLPPSHYPYIADAIELRGRVEQRNDMLVFYADFGTLRRLEE